MYAKQITTKSDKPVIIFLNHYNKRKGYLLDCHLIQYEYISGTYFAHIESETPPYIEYKYLDIRRNHYTY